jgi:hypothetical protein
MDQGNHLADARFKKLRDLVAQLFGATSTPTGSFVVAVGAISPDPPPPPGDTLFALPNDNTLSPTGTPFAPSQFGLNYVWTFPAATKLKRCALHGKAATIGTVNTLGAGGPQPHDVDVFVDGVFVTTLFTIAAGATDVDLSANPDVPIPAGSELQIAIPAALDESGELSNFLFSFSIGA